MAKRGGRRFLWIFGVVAVLLVAAVGVALVFAPAIASAVAPGIVAGLVSDSVRGEARVQSVRLSWGGPQRIEDLVIVDARGTTVADVSLSTDARLLDLVRGKLDLGEVRVSGAIALEGDLSAGEIRTADVLAGGSGQPRRGGAATLPESLRARVVVDGLTVRYTDVGPDAGVRVVELRDMRGGATIAPGVPLEAALEGGVDADGAPGTFDFEARVSDWSSAGGQLMLGSARGTGSLRADVPASLASLISQADAFVDASGGGRIEVDVSADGDGSLMDVAAALRAPGLAFDGRAAVTADEPRSVRATGPISLSARVSQDTLAALGVGADALTLDAPADLRLDVDRLRVSMAPGGGLDLRGAVIDGQLSSSELRGAVRGTGDGAPTSFAARGLRASLTSDDVAESVRIAASMDATYGGEDAGMLRVDMAARDLVDAQGALRTGGLPSIEGVAEARGFRTAILQPFAAAVEPRLDLVRDVGPVLDARAEASTSATDAGARSDIRLRVSSAGAKLDGGLVVDDAGVRSDEGLTLTLSRLGATLTALLGESGVRVDPGREVIVQITNLDAPAQGGTIDPAMATADVSVRAAEAVAVFPSTGEEIAASLRADAALRPGEAPSLRADLEGRRGGEAFSLRADLAAPRAFDAGAVGLERAALRGSIVGERVPLSLARALGVAQEDVELARLAAGETLNVRAELVATEGALVDARVTAAGALLEASAEAVVRESEAAVRSFEAAWSPSESFVLAAQRRFAPEMEPVRATANRLVATLEPLTVPLGEGMAPKLESMGPVTVRLRGEGPVEVREAVELFGDRRSAGVRNLEGVVRWAMGEIGERTVALEGALFDPEGGGGALGDLSASADLRATPMQARLIVSEASTAGLDAWLGQPGLLELSLGETATLEASVTPTDAGGAARVSARLDSTRLDTAISAMMGEDRYTLLEPVEARWTMDPRWATRYLAAGEEGEPPAFEFETETPMTVRIGALTIARGEGPLLPGVFEAAIRAEAGEVRLRTKEGERVALQSLRAEATTSDGGRAMGFRVGLGALQGRSGATGDAAVVEGTARDFATEDGAPDVANGQVSLTANGEIPTALLDALGGGGRLGEMLGPLVTAQIRANEFSRRGGTLDAQARSARASASVRGRVVDGVFVSAEPARAELREITEEFSVSAMKGLTPVLGAIKKTASDRASVLSVADLRFPLGVVSEKARRAEAEGAPRPAFVDLNGTVRLDLGEVQYKLNKSLGAILRPDQYSDETFVKREIPALEATITDGFMRYARTRIPLRDFEVETEGQVDLARNVMDTTVWVPAFALVSDFLNLFGQKGLGELLQGVPVLDQISNTTMMPVRMKGPVDSPRVEPDVDRFIRELGPRAIERGVGDVLDKLFKPKDK